MKIRQWLGFNEDASQYLLRPGELRVLNNLQSRRPGMLIARKGLTKIYGKYNNEIIYSIYRRATVLGNPSDFLWLQRVLSRRVLTQEQLDARESLYEYVWNVLRIEGNQSRVIDTLPITNVRNFCVAEDRHGRIFLFYGHGLRPRLYRPNSLANVAIPMGLDAPTSAPSVVPSGTGYFIENVDVQFGGGAYYEPPELTVSGGDPEKPAKLKAIVQSGNVIGVDIVDGGVNYQSAPTITASSAKIGTGFRAKGIVSSTARTIEGFAAGKNNTDLVGAAADPATETYGEHNGTTNNRIMYSAQPRVTTERVLSGSGTSMTLGSVEGITPGLVLTVFPPATGFLNPASSWRTAAGTNWVTAVNATTKTITLSSPWTPVAGTTYEATFYHPATTAYATADYDAARRRYTATFPLRSNSTTGSGAHATLEFSPAPRGFALNTSSSTSIAITRQRWNQYPFKVGNSTTWNEILYEEYWEGSDYDKQNTTWNSRYIGLQASGSQYIKGFSGTVSNKRADVYWPDYSKISVWFCTGTYSSNISQWTRVDVPVTTVNGAKVLEFQLRPTQAATTVTNVGGSTITTQYQPYQQMPGVVSPTVRIFLRDCPESWVVNSDQCSPTSVKEAQPNRQQWWSAASGVPRPIVDLIPPGSTVNDQAYIDAVQIIDGGQGWQQNTLFAFRLYRANPFDQYVDYNTAVSEQAVSRGHSYYTSKIGRRQEPQQYIEYRLTANAPDTQTPHGPPSYLITPCEISIPGDGYRTNDYANLLLHKRPLSGTPAQYSTSLSLGWVATTLDTLSATTEGQIASITILNQGRNYLAAPTIEVRGGGTGYGLSVLPQVSGGRITGVQIIDPGRSYTSQPELYTEARSAQLSPVMRPAMRGKYRCAYRYVDVSETVVGEVTAVLGDSSSVLVVSDPTDIKPDMILESPSLPHFARVKSVNDTRVEINQEIIGLAPNVTITITVRDMTKPIGYSDFSPIADVDAGPNESRTHCSKMQWSIPGATPPIRADKVELWRTSADQSLVYYRVESYGRPTQNGVQIVGDDTLTDEQLFDPDRPHYAAMPIVLPNGNVNAYRFGKPRDDMAVAVAFQDRLWMGVSTSGDGVNTLYYSEYDEFESFPDTNELPIQNNQKHTDVLTALVPFGSMLLAMQHTHTYSVTFNSDPGIDGAIQMLSHRGCLHQRCWDIHENVLYAADESGIYSLSRAGEVQDISLPLRDYFVSEILDFTKRETFFLQVDPRTHILRFFCTLKSKIEDTPTIALCYDLMAKAWWTESYPNSITAACTGRPDSARINTILLGAVDGNMYEIDGDSDHANDSLTDCFVTSGGRGYREAPEITVPNCKGAVVKGVVSEGRLVDVIIQNAGWEARWGIGIITEGGDPIATHDGKDIKGVEYDAIKLDVGPPDEGGTQAVAYANFSVTPIVKRDSTVSLGEDYVRIESARIAAFEPESYTALTTEAGDPLCWTSVVNSTPNVIGGEIQLQPLPVEIGMEAIGDYIPLNSFVSRIHRNNIHLAHPDGTPVSILLGAPRTNASGTPSDWLENGGTPMQVTFYKPYRTHVPFRAATGFMQLMNEENTKNGDSLIDRSISLVYTPTASDKTIEVLERFNGRDELRPNNMRRSRGGPGSFVHRQDSASTALNISKNASRLGFATGVATAKFANRVYADMTGEDQHLQVEVYGRPEQASPWQRLNFWNPNPQINAPQPFVMHSMTVEGVVVDAE